MDNPKTPESAAELRWTVHPLLEEPPAKTGLLILVILGLSILIAVEFDAPAYGFLTAALLTASMSRYFLPTRYALQERHILIAHLGAKRTLPWNRIRRHTVAPDGVFLSPFARPHRLDPFRGCFLRRRENLEEIIDYVQARLADRAH
ncbi:MAG: hypothetical protein OXU79_15700 [Gemmatimonadota bacterium]|nr:hypothetical protein [Gemmatimonadota bacterium]